jgi:hypothetical protein
MDIHKINGLHLMRLYVPYCIPYECYKLWMQPVILTISIVLSQKIAP